VEKVENIFEVGKTYAPKRGISAGVEKVEKGAVNYGLKKS
jgi:hypothetical protein